MCKQAEGYELPSKGKASELKVVFAADDQIDTLAQPTFGAVLRSACDLIEAMITDIKVNVPPSVRVYREMEAWRDLLERLNDDPGRRPGEPHGARGAARRDADAGVRAARSLRAGDSPCGFRSGGMSRTGYPPGGPAVAAVGAAVAAVGGALTIFPENLGENHLVSLPFLDMLPQCPESVPPFYRADQSEKAAPHCVGNWPPLITWWEG
jgi:hypothetical protein